MSSIHRAVLQRNPAAVRRNIADINTKDHHGFTPLHYASKFNDVEMIELLLRLGAKDSIPDDYGILPSELCDNDDARGPFAFALQKKYQHTLSSSV